MPTRWALTAQSACGRQPGDPGPGEEAPTGFQFSRAHVTSAARLLVLGVAVRVLVPVSQYSFSERGAAL